MKKPYKVKARERILKLKDEVDKSIEQIGKKEVRKILENYFGLSPEESGTMCVFRAILKSFIPISQTRIRTGLSSTENQSISKVTQTEAVIEWETDRPSGSLVYYRERLLTFAPDTNITWLVAGDSLLRRCKPKRQRLHAQRPKRRGQEGRQIYQRNQPEAS